MYGSSARGLRFQRFYTLPGTDPFEGVTWETRELRTCDEDAGVEVPAFWSDTAARIVAARYFRRPLGSPREHSVRQVVRRVAGTIARWGREGGYFAREQDSEAFEAELIHVLLHQIACFNSPVWFNVGVEEHPQCAGTFILSVEDSMESILELARVEGSLFKHGSGTGTDLSTLRSAGEPISAGGRAAGPVSFMKGLDAMAGSLRCGGKTRRAAKMAVLDIGHPDILEFIRCKAVEERKAWALIDAGYDGVFSAASGAYDTVAFQNANHSVRAPDAFLEAVTADGPWTTRALVGGRPAAAFRARDLLARIAEAAWLCGDPGLQYETTINAWNPCPPRATSARATPAASTCSWTTRAAPSRPST